MRMKMNIMIAKLNDFVSCFAHREILEKQITPVVLDIEEKAKDEDEKHCADCVLQKLNLFALIVLKKFNLFALIVLKN